ncbi:MAG: methylated-DNA--[protein]-cysteine S-methyltransferase [Candidatus Bipolaricaulota bacterium]
MTWTQVPTTWGTFVAGWEGEKLTRLLFPNGATAGGVPAWGGLSRSPSLASQLEAYFLGTRREFTVCLHLRGTPFQLQVWQELMRVPFGRVVTYGELARRVGRPNGARATGGAIGANPIPIIIPCHRVIGAGGRLGGFGAGLRWKRLLLTLEGMEGDSPQSCK